MAEVKKVPLRKQISEVLSQVHKYRAILETNKNANDRKLALYYIEVYSAIYDNLLLLAHLKSIS